MKQKHLFPLIRKNVIKLLNGYIQLDSIINKIDEYIVYQNLETMLVLWFNCYRM